MMSRTDRELFNVKPLKRTLKHLYEKNPNMVDPRNFSDDAFYQFLRKKVSQRNKRISIRQIGQRDFKRYADQVRIEVMFEKEKENQQSRTELNIGINQPFQDQFNRILSRGSYLAANHYDRDEDYMIGGNTYLNDGRMTVSEFSLHMDEKSSQESGMNINPEAVNTALQEKQEICRENEAVKEQKREEYKNQNQIKFQLKPQLRIQNTQSIKNQVQIQVSLLGLREHLHQSHEEMIQVEEQDQSVRQVQPLADQEAQYEALIVPDIELQMQRVVDQIQLPNEDDHPPAQLMIGQTINEALFVGQHEVVILQPQEMIQPPIPQYVIQEILPVQQNQNPHQQPNPFNHDNLEPEESRMVSTIKIKINHQLKDYQDEYIREQNQNIISQPKLKIYLTKKQKIATTNINPRQRLENQSFRIGNIQCKMCIANDGRLRVQRIEFVIHENGPKIVTSMQPLVNSTNLLEVTGIKQPQRHTCYLSFLKQFKIVE